MSGLLTRLIWMNAGTPTSCPVHSWPSTVPVTLPQVAGGSTCIVTGTGLTAWPAPVAARVTVTRTRWPGPTVNFAGSSESHGTSAVSSHWSSPLRRSDSGAGVNGSLQPPILYAPQAPAPRARASPAVGASDQLLLAGSYAIDRLVSAVELPVIPPASTSRPLADECCEPHRSTGIAAIGIQLSATGS